MANDLIPGYVYILESDAVDNQNWIPTVANIDLATNFVEGTDFCKLKIPQQWVKGGTTGLSAEDASGGKSFVTRTYRKSYKMVIQGIEVIGSDAEKIHTFIMSNVHTATSSATFNYYYLIIIRSATDYEQFYDDGGTLRDYCQIIIPDWKITWNESKALTANVLINCRSAWGAS